MNLRQKLLTTFGGLGVLALVTAGMSVWAILQWQGTEEKLQSHYERSLLLQRVRAAVFRAVKEVPDAVIGSDQQARLEFNKSLESIEPDFKRWAELAHNNEERQQVEQVRKAYETLISDARTAINLVEKGRKNEALQLMTGELENDFVPFQTLTEEAVASDRNYRKVIRAGTQRTRETTELVLAIAAFGTVSLVLLLAAYLASDLFAPLREVKQALDDLAAGDLERRLDEERNDELGAINRAFNQMAEVIQEREQVAQLAAFPAGVADEGANGSALQQMPSRLTLHRLVSQLRAQVTHLSSNQQVDGDGAVVTQDKQELMSQLDQLLQAVSRLTEFGFPLDLNLARTDIRALIYEVLLRFHDEFAQRAISFELDIAPEVSYAVVDRLKLREVLAELVRNALAAMPESGGRLGIRTGIAADGTQLLVEIADNGTGAEQPLIEQAFALRDNGEHQPTRVGLKLTKAIVEQHGGHLEIDSRPGVGTYVQIQIPLRE